MAGKIIPFIIGGAVGAAAALLYAPRTGEETRAYVADKANETWGSMQNYGSSAQDRGQRIYEDAVARGQAAYQNVAETASAAYTRATSTAQDAINTVQDRVQEVAGNAKPFATTQNDELREKIEAARQRIAAQVAKNAAAAEDAVVETEAVVEQEEASEESEESEESKEAE